MKISRKKHPMSDIAIIIAPERKMSCKKRPYGYSKTEQAAFTQKQEYHW